MISTADIARRFRVRDSIIKSWIREGVIPQGIWSNGRRYWSSNDINALIAGCPVTLPHEAKSTIKEFTCRPYALSYASNNIAIVVTLVTR